MSNDDHLEDIHIMTNLNKLVAILSCLSLLACGIGVSDDQQQQPKKQADDSIDIKLVSEAFGHFIGRNLKSPGAEFDLESVLKGIREGATGAASPMSDQDYEKAMTKLQEKAFENLAQQNLEAANAFLQKNQSEKDIVQIEPGKLQYMILKAGNGESVEPHGTPQIHYTGKYVDGTVFGSSEEAGGPITIPLDQTIPGFSKGLLGMKEGEKRRLFIHPDLGYGTLGNLPPNALLIFDIEIVKARPDVNETVEEDLAMGDEDDSALEEDISDEDDENPYGDS